MSAPIWEQKQKRGGEEIRWKYILPTYSNEILHASNTIFHQSEECRMCSKIKYKSVRYLQTENQKGQIQSSLYCEEKQKFEE